MQKRRHPLCRRCQSRQGRYNWEKILSREGREVFLPPRRLHRRYWEGGSSTTPCGVSDDAGWRRLATRRCGAERFINSQQRIAPTATLHFGMGAVHHHLTMDP